MALAEQDIRIDRSLESLDSQSREYFSDFLRGDEFERLSEWIGFLINKRTRTIGFRNWYEGNIKSFIFKNVGYRLLREKVGEGQTLLSPDQSFELLKSFNPASAGAIEGGINLNPGFRGGNVRGGFIINQEGKIVGVCDYVPSRIMLEFVGKMGFYGDPSIVLPGGIPRAALQVDNLKKILVFPKRDFGLHRSYFESRGTTLEETPFYADQLNAISLAITTSVEEGHYFGQGYLIPG